MKSLLGLLLFLICMNDLLLVRLCKIQLYLWMVSIYIVPTRIWISYLALWITNLIVPETLNTNKTKFTLLNKLRRKDYIPIWQPVLRIDKAKAERTNSIKFLGVLLSEHLSWNHNIHLFLSKIPTNERLIYKAKFVWAKITSNYLQFVNFSFT